MSLDLYFSPFFLKFSGFIDKEGTPFYPDHLSAVHVFFFDHFEQVADFLLCIREQVKGEVIFLLELFMGGQFISRNAQYDRVTSLEFQMMRFEVAALICASRGAIFRVEINNDIFSAQRFQLHHFITGCGQLK